jgi:hypothetical protein
LAERDVDEIEQIANAREAERKAEMELAAKEKVAEAEAAQKAAKKAEAERAAKALEEAAEKAKAEEAKAEAEKLKASLSKPFNIANVGCNSFFGAVAPFLQFEGAVVFAQPLRANVPLGNASAARGKIVIVARDPEMIPEDKRCSFDQKAAMCVDAGAIGMLIANTPGSPLVRFNVHTGMSLVLGLCARSMRSLPLAAAGYRLPCAMMTDVYAAGLKDGDYVVVDKNTICQRTAAPMCHAHAPSHRYTAQLRCFVCCAGRPMASVPPASAAAPKRCAALSCSFYGSPDSGFCSKHDPSVIAKSPAVRWGGAHNPRMRAPLATRRQRKCSRRFSARYLPWDRPRRSPSSRRRRRLPSSSPPTCCARLVATRGLRPKRCSVALR